MVQLTKNFTLDELTVGCSNFNDYVMTCELKHRLLRLSEVCLQPIRDEWGRVVVTCGYRSVKYNDYVKGSKTSYHLGAMAADICVNDLIDVFFWCIENVNFTELILERKLNKKFSWIHIAFGDGEPKRNPKLVAFNKFGDKIYIDLVNDKEKALRYIELFK